jgi:hypothetical protein
MENMSVAFDLVLDEIVRSNKQRDGEVMTDLHDSKMKCQTSSSIP